MTKNVCSPLDKTLRIIGGLAIMGTGWYYGSLWGLLGIIPLATVATGLCPLYSVLGISTCPAEKQIRKN